MHALGRRAVRRFGAALSIGVVLTFVFVLPGGVRAQTTSPTSTVAPTTTLPTTTTAPPTTTTAPSATTTPAPPPGAPTAASTSNGDRSWLPIAIGGVVAAAMILAGLLVWRRRRAHRAEQLAEWHHAVADATDAAAPAVRELLSGARPSAALARQVVLALRALQDLEHRAPDATERAAVIRARRALRRVGVAMDDAHQLLRSQPPPPRERIGAAAGALRRAAADAQRALEVLVPTSPR